MTLILKWPLGLTPNLSYGLLASSTQRQYSDISHISYMLCDIYLTYVSKSFGINSFFLNSGFPKFFSNTILFLQV